MIDVPATELREGLLASLAVERWADDVLAAAPFESVEALLERAREAATPPLSARSKRLSRIILESGETPVGTGTAQSFSRAEQAGLGDDDADLIAAIAAGNIAYEERFGRVFIIRAAGRTRAEILEELERRLELPNSTELEIVGEQLRDIALLRLEKLYGERE